MNTRLPLLEHLAEMRNRLLVIILAWLAIFIIGAFYAAELYEILARPVLKILPEGSSLIATKVPSPFLAPLKLAAFVALFITLPLAFVQVWRFVAPGLYRREKRLAFPLVFTSLLFFYAGTLFVYFIVIPTAVGFFYQVAPQDILIMPDINSYLSFSLRLALVFGVAFELPIIIFVLVKTGLVQISWLRKNRPYLIVGCFVIAMLLTPPDVLSQIFLALPLCLLYELGILSASLTIKDTSRDSTKDATKKKSVL